MLAGILTDDVEKLVVVVGAAAVVLVFWIVATAVRRMQNSEDRAALVGMMLQRGMSAEQIERVLLASGLAEQEESSENPPDLRIISTLKENEYSGDDIEEVLTAAKHGGVIDDATAAVVESMVEQGAKSSEIVGVLYARRGYEPAGVRARTA